MPLKDRTDLLTGAEMVLCDRLEHLLGLLEPENGVEDVGALLSVLTGLDVLQRLRWKLAQAPGGPARRHKGKT